MKKKESGPNPRVAEVVRKVLPFLQITDRIIDIGGGSCEVAAALRGRGFAVMPLDVKDGSVIEEIKPIIYDGKTIPFDDDSFDVSLLITVLHHTKDPVAVLREAKRISRRIVVMEDIHSSIFQKYLTFAMDSYVNREFFGHPHSNKTEAEWEKVFEELDLKVVGRDRNDFWRFFTSGTFFLEKDIQRKGR